MGDATKGPESIRIQADIPQPQRRSGKLVTVKVERDRHGARISTKDETLVMLVGLDTVSKRMRRGERVAYFRAELLDGILELGDRLPEYAW